MSKNYLRVALLALVAFVATACNKESGSVATPTADASPDAAVRTSVQLLKDGNVGGLIEHAMPPADFAKFKAEWGKDKNEQPITDEDRKKFAETLAKLTAPDAEQKIYAEIEPQLTQFDAQYQQQMPVMVGMGRGYLKGLVEQNKELNETQKQQALAAIGAFADWVEKTRFTDPALVKKAIAVIVDTTRKLNLTTLDEARALNYDQSMQKAQIAFQGFKRVLGVYGFNFDQTLDSVKAEVVSNDGNAAKVKVSYTLLNSPLSAETDMIKVDGRWYGKETIEKLKQREAEAAAPAAPNAPAAPTPPADPARSN